MSNLNWGIVGTGWIGSEMAEALWAVDGTVYGVCGSSLEKAEGVFNNLIACLSESKMEE